MGWHLNVIENELRLSEEQAEKLVDILEKTWDNYRIYRSAHGGKEELIEFFGGDPIEFDDECMEHMDYLHDGDMQAALVAVGARGFVTMADLHGDNPGYAWTHEFTEAGYVYRVGKIHEMLQGKMPA